MLFHRIFIHSFPFHIANKTVSKIYKRFELNQQNFDKAAAQVKSLTKRPTDDELLKLYALFKQGSIGDNNTNKPGLLDLKGKAKWNAWNDLNGTSQDGAKQDYIDFVNQLVAKYE